MDKTVQFSGGVSEIETTKNKVTNIDENSTNTQYPSAKAVFDYVGEASGMGHATAEGGEIFNDYENNEATGKFSSARGENNEAAADHADACGLNTKASGKRSVSRNYGTKASGNDSSAYGHNTEASGWAADSRGKDTVASGSQASASGKHTRADGEWSVSEGWDTRALGNESRAQGIRTLAQGRYGAFAHGGYGGAYDYQTESGGYGCLISGNNSMGNGHSSKTKGYTCNAQGFETIAGLSGWGVTRIVKLSDTQIKVYLYDGQPNSEIALADCITPGTYSKDGTDETREFYSLDVPAGKAFGDSAIASAATYVEGIIGGAYTENPVLYVNGETYVPDAMETDGNMENPALTLTFNNGVPDILYSTEPLTEISLVENTALTSKENSYTDIYGKNILATASLDYSVVGNGTGWNGTHYPKHTTLTDGYTNTYQQIQVSANMTDAGDYTQTESYIEMVFTLSETINNPEKFLFSYYKGAGSLHYALYAADTLDNLFNAPIYTYSSATEDSIEHIVNVSSLELKNIKYFAIRFYNLRLWGNCILPYEIGLYGGYPDTFGIDDMWLGNYDNCGYPIRACAAANARGYKTEAYGLGSNANGVGTKALFKGQTALGTYNKPNPDALLIVGNGTSDEDRHNALEVCKNGSLKVNGFDYGLDFAPAITNSLCGKAIIATDVSSLEHSLDIKVSSDTIEDLSAVTLTKFGKNILPFGKDRILDSVGSFTFDEEGVYGTHGDGASNYVMFSTKYLAGTYSFSAEYSYDTVKRILIRCFDSDGNIMTDVFSRHNPHYKAYIIEGDSIDTFTVPDTVSYWCFGWVSMSATVGEAASLKFPQLECGAVVTDYEPCKVQTVTANADGTVEDLKSVSPNMMLISDNAEAVINVEYKADTKLYIDNKFAEIKSELQALILEG